MLLNNEIFEQVTERMANTGTVLWIDLDEESEIRRFREGITKLRHRQMKTSESEN